MQAEQSPPGHQDVHSSIWFLARKELYATVKPYTLAFTPDSAIPRENIVREKKNLIISDIRGRLSNVSFDRNGFTVLDMPEHSKAVNWDDKSSVELECYPEVVIAVESAFPGASCIPLQHQVCTNLL